MTLTLSLSLFTQASFQEFFNFTFKNGNFDKLLKFLKFSENKDKLLKVLQYLIKLIIISTRQRGPLNDLKSFASTLSLARKLSRLGNWLSGIKDLNDLKILNRNNFDISLDSVLMLVATVSSIGNDLLDDWICLQKTKLLTKRPYLNTLDLWSTRLWFVSVSIELFFTLQKLKLIINQTDDDREKENEDDYHFKRNKRHTDTILTASKQLCDLTFCLWELADLSSFNEYIPVASGLTAATIGAIRGWRKLE